MGFATPLAESNANAAKAPLIEDNVVSYENKNFGPQKEWMEKGTVQVDDLWRDLLGGKSRYPN